MAHKRGGRPVKNCGKYQAVNSEGKDSGKKLAPATWKHIIGKHKGVTALLDDTNLHLPSENVVPEHVLELRRGCHWAQSTTPNICDAYKQQHTWHCKSIPIPPFVALAHAALGRQSELQEA
jgi:hypothetical protein